MGVPGKEKGRHAPKQQIQRETYSHTDTNTCIHTDTHSLKKPNKNIQIHINTHSTPIHILTVILSHIQKQTNIHTYKITKYTYIKHTYTQTHYMYIYACRYISTITHIYTNKKQTSRLRHTGIHTYTFTSYIYAYKTAPKYTYTHIHNQK